MDLCLIRDQSSLRREFQTRHGFIMSHVSKEREVALPHRFCVSFRSSVVVFGSQRYAGLVFKGVRKKRRK